MAKPQLVLLLLLALASFASAISIGDRLLRDYTEYEPMPITSKDALNAGWTIGSTCDRDRGYTATYKGSGKQSLSFKFN